MSNRSEKLTLDAPELAKVLGICKPRAYESALPAGSFR